ncbi:MAG: polyprenyl synthetase family protein [Thermodesulfobacteriota bacterium]
MVGRFQDYWERMKPRLDDAFERQLSMFLESTNMSDAAPLRATLEGGKKIRGCLLCMVSDTLGGVLESAIPRAVAVELIQTATLIHDDFVDQDTARRNRPAAWTLAGARRAVLLGDVIFARAIKMMNDLSREDGMVIAHAIAQVSRGAFYETLNPISLIGEIESNRLNGELYEKIIRLKTGTLFGAACQLGAIAAEAHAELSERFHRYGSRIGEAYQIADDLQEVKGHIFARSIRPDQIAVLTPTFLYFVKEMRPHIPRLLEGQCPDLDGVLLEYFRVAERLMESEIERRLLSAVSEIEDLQCNEYGELARTAPWDLIGMISVP